MQHYIAKHKHPRRIVSSPEIGASCDPLQDIYQLRRSEDLIAQYFPLDFRLGTQFLPVGGTVTLIK